MLKNVVQGAVKDNIRQMISQFPSGFLLLNDDTGELYAASERAMSALKLDTLPTHWGQWPVPLKEFQLSLEGPDVQRAEVTIPWPENPRTFGFNLSTVKLDNLGTVRVCLFSDITQVIQDRLALEQFKTAFMDMGSAETQLTRLLLALPDMQNTLSTLAMVNQTCQQQLQQPETGANVLPMLTRMAQYLDDLSHTLARLHGDPHPLNVRQVTLEQALKSAWLLVFTGQAALDSLPDSHTQVLADSIRLEQAIGLILKAQPQAMPHQLVPALDRQETAVTLTWQNLGHPDNRTLQLAQHLLTAMGMHLAISHTSLQLTAGLWCQADEAPQRLTV
jgi:hypothetical protein